MPPVEKRILGLVLPRGGGSKEKPSRHDEILELATIHRRLREHRARGSFKNPFEPGQVRQVTRLVPLEDRPFLARSLALYELEDVRALVLLVKRDDVRDELSGEKEMDSGERDAVLRSSESPACRGGE